ncbi:MAG: flagellar export protein FliJ [Treponema sp.]|jgi:flagellar export protein FliJ|nr:flagellar export protein FliJ [Treponema sp.]
MKRFSFNLQKTLELRRYREQEAKAALGRAVGVLTAIENRIQETAVTRHTAARQRFADPAAMPAWDHYIIRLDQETERLTQEAARAALAVEEQRAQYLAASGELKVMEKLKEKREKEYRTAMFAAETAEADDRWREKVYR